MTSNRLTAAIAGSDQLTISAPICSNTLSDMIPKAAVASSIEANKGSRLIARCFETQPPARLPSPSPSMNAATTMVTDSEFTPKMRKSSRCHVSWYQSWKSGEKEQTAKSSGPCGRANCRAYRQVERRHAPSFGKTELLRTNSQSIVAENCIGAGYFRRVCFWHEPDHHRCP